MLVRRGSSAEIEEELDDFERMLQRLRIEYDQYFMGGMRREPTQLRGEVQRFITKYMSSPPRNAALKFRFNSLVARYQAFRAIWGRTQREIEAGTYKRHRFRLALQALEAREAAGERGRSPRRKRPAAASGGSAIDKLYEALSRARTRTGEAGRIDRASLERAVRKQTAELRRKHGDAKVRFKVVIEGNKAKLKAKVDGS